MHIRFSNNYFLYVYFYYLVLDDGYDMAYDQDSRRGQGDATKDTEHEVVQNPYYGTDVEEATDVQVVQNPYYGGNMDEENDVKIVKNPYYEGEVEV